MKYFFNLLFFGWISLNTLVSYGYIDFQDTSISLENTKIGQAVIEGKIEEYEAAVKELKAANIPLLDILEKRTPEGENLLELMVGVKLNKNYFAMEMLNIYALFLYFPDKNNTDNFDFTSQTERLRDKAKQVDNQTAISMLSEMTKRLTQDAENLHKKNKRQLFANLGIIAVGTAASVWGVYEVLGPETFAFSKVISSASMAAGVGSVVQGLRKCQAAFQTRGQIKTYKKQINRHKNSINPPPPRPRNRGIPLII